MGTKATEGLLKLQGNGDSWATEDDDETTGVNIQSTYIYEWGLKIFRVEAEVDINARVLWEDFVINMNDTADWNSDMKEVKLMDRVNSCTDIVRQTLHEIPGLMTSRSLLLVRQWSKLNGMFYLATTSITSSRFPEPEGVVTGNLYPSGMIFIPNKANPQKMTFVWFFAVDLKLGWVPQYFMDIGFMRGQKAFIKSLRNHAKTMQS
uniref:Steroidogenic acute regulatory protein, mitochondrial-like n=1 Tax=Crassostrea virginica TaxID=6565 RepID=A0A8B8C391_CRAVI|nr:steroidogenic acute regulatory protein, mitochondrial-like [Crassostrea virginica]